MRIDKIILEWEELPGDWQKAYLTNFPIYYTHHLHEAIKFFANTVNSFPKDDDTYKSYHFLHDFVDTQFDQTLRDQDMRRQTMTALAFYEVFKIFTVEYTKYCIMFQRKNGIHPSEQGIPETAFLKEGRRLWAENKPSPELEQQYAKMMRYNEFRNKMAHNLICRIEYKLKDKPLEKFLEASPGIRFNSKAGAILKLKSDPHPDKNSAVRNIYIFSGGEFVNQFCIDSIKFFSLLIKHCYPDFTPPAPEKT